MENHHDLEIATQVKRLVLTGLIDDISVRNAYALEAELTAMTETFHAPYPLIKVDTEPEITEDERIALFDNLHSYRGDRSDYVLCSTMTRICYKDRPFPAHTMRGIVQSDALIDNVGYGQCRGETQAALKKMKNDGRVSAVGRISDDERFLLEFLKPWSSFEPIEDK